MKILILRFSSIGDIVLTSPVIRTLKRQLPEASIHYGTKKQYQSILENNPHIDQLHFLNDNLKALILTLKEEKFDLIIDLHKNLRTWRIKSALKCKSYSFEKLNFQKWLLVNLKINRLPTKHIVDRYMDTIMPLNIQNDQKGLDYFIHEKDVVKRDWLPEPFVKKYYAFAIGGQHSTKKLPFKKMIELCDRINNPVILLGGQEDQAIGEQIEKFFERKEHHKPYEKGLKELNKKTVVFNGCGKFNLNQSASVIQQAEAVFTHDTGLMHIAAAFKKKVYSIWGNTTPFFGMYPYQTSFVVFENNKIKCRPCSKIGYSKCPKGHFKCMNDMTFDFYLPD